MRKLAFFAPLLFVACGGDEAVATIESRSGSMVTGSAVFTVSDDVVTMELSIAGATAGSHGLHLHEKGDCSAADGTSAGGHWNPTAMMHGMPTAAAHHRGDMGNIEVGADGTVTFTFSNPDWTLKAETSTAADVVGRAIVVHEKADDFGQPLGNAGARQGCGVVTLSE